ncbi:MAG: hypothetical protein GXO39_01140 [Thermotogae bacterium]|nr:hypothetical protein [Thermotogota bacterium]
MLHGVLRIILLSLGSAILYLNFINPRISFLLLGVLLMLVAALWIRKALELGVRSVRGQFYAIMSFAFLFQGVGFTFTDVSSSIHLPFIALVSYTLARFFFFTANFRYIFYFQSLGYRLTFKRATVVVILTLLSAVLTLLIPRVPTILLTLSPFLLFLLLDVGMVFIVIYNMLLLWGSEIARRWAVGSVVIVSFLMGDAFFIAGAPPIASLGFWTIASTLMGIIATIRG